MQFIINIQKTVTSNQTFNIEAENEEEAKIKSLKLAKDIVFKNENIKYSVEGIEIHNIKDTQ